MFFIALKNLKAGLENERNCSHEALNHCFVAYKSLREAAIAGYGLAWDHYTDQLQARMCPEKDDIVWENLKRDRRLRLLRNLLTGRCYVIIVRFFLA